MFVGEMFEVGKPDLVGIGDLAPGVELMGILAGVDRDSLSGFDRVEVLKARARLRSHLDAELLADMSGILDAEVSVVGSDLEWGDVHGVAAAEIGAALSWTRRAAERQLDFAATLVSDYPRVWEMLRVGLIDLPRARVIVEHTVHLEDEVRDQVVNVALEKAPDQTTGLLAARIRRLALWVAPDSAKKRYEEGLEERRLVSEANPDGTANLCGYQLPSERSQAAARRINKLAHQLKASGDPRTLDQIRADLLLDLLNGTGAQTSSPDRGTVDIQVELTTLLELDDKPGEIHGWGPVISDIARQVTEEQVGSEWRYTVTDEHGNPVAVGTTRRRPTISQKRLAQILNPTCVFPGCRMPSIDCDLDHNRPWAQGGQTTEENLGPLCRHHHVIRHHGWTIIQTQPGSYQLTSPLGHSYTSQPRAP
jgi:hypothetical protein